MLASVTYPLRWLSGLIEWEGRRGGRLVVGWPSTRVMALGSAAFMGATGLAVLGTVRNTTGTAGSFSYSAPNAPTVSVTVSDTSTWIVSGQAFVGSGDATHDSTQIQVDRASGNFSSPLTEVVIGAQTIDTISDNTDWKADSSYIVRMRYKANPNKGGWSAYDSATVTNTVTATYPNRPASMTLATQWDGTSESAPTGWSIDASFSACASVQADGGGITNPLGTGSSLKIAYVSGSGNQCGSGPSINSFSGGPYNQVYIMYRIYIDPSWDEGHGQKLYYWDQLSSTNPTKYYVTRESSASSYELRVQDNFGGGTSLTASSFWSGARGTWVNVELWHNTDTDSVYVWKNGTLEVRKGVGADTDVTGMKWYLERNDNHTQSEYFLIGELSAWVKN